MCAMRVFDPRMKQASLWHVRIYAYYEVIFTLMDFAAAFLFIVGSILFNRLGSVLRQYGEARIQNSRLQKVAGIHVTVSTT